MLAVKATLESYVEEEPKTSTRLDELERASVANLEEVRNIRSQMVARNRGLLGRIIAQLEVLEESTSDVDGVDQV